MGSLPSPAFDLGLVPCLNPVMLGKGHGCTSNKPNGHSSLPCGVCALCQALRKHSESVSVLRVCRASLPVWGTDNKRDSDKL